MVKPIGKNKAKLNRKNGNKIVGAKLSHLQMLKPIGLSLWVLMEKLYRGFLVNEWRELHGPRAVPVTRATEKKGLLVIPDPDKSCPTYSSKYDFHYLML
jgi:hypothetical protein